MKVITFAHQKGGVGKSTLAINLAHSLNKKGYKVALKDFDLQGTTLTIGAAIGTIDTYNQKEMVEKQYDFLIVDTPPYLNPILVDLFANSDLVLIPTKPSTPDILAIKGTIELFKKAKVKNNNIKGKIVVNQVISSSNIIELLQDELCSLELELIETKIENRVSYARSLIEVNGIYSDTDKKAQAEIDQFTNEILKLI